MPKHPVAKPDLPDEKILSTAELLTRLPLTRQSLWRMSREGRFVQPIALTKSRIGWRWSDVLAWLNQREKRPLERRAYFPGNNDTTTADKP